MRFGKNHYCFFLLQNLTCCFVKIFQCTHCFGNRQSTKRFYQMFKIWNFECVALRYYVRSFWSGNPDWSKISVDGICVISNYNITRVFQFLYCFSIFYTYALNDKHNKAKNGQCNKIIKEKIPCFFEWICWQIFELFVNCSFKGFSFKEIVVFFIGIKFYLLHACSFIA